MHASDWPMSYHPAEVINDADPLFSGRLQVLSTGLYPTPIWVQPLYAPGLFALPAITEKVALFQVGPQQYRWGFTLREKADVLPATLLAEYPFRRALLGKPPVVGAEPAMVGIDAAGIAYVGHFNATEPMVLGQSQLTQLVAALQAVENALQAIVGAQYGATPGPMDGGSIALVSAAKIAIGNARTTLPQTLSTVARVAATPTT